MNIRIATTMATMAALLALAACSDTGSGSVLHYTVLKKTWSPAKLLVENPTKASATAAINDWLSTNAGDHDAFLVDVYAHRHDAEYVCRGEYYVDARTAFLVTERKLQASSWPHTFVTCRSLDS